MGAPAAVRKAVEHTGKKVAHGVKQAAVGPRADSPAFVTREVAIGLFLGAIGGSIWKMYHLNLRRQCQEFYDGLEKGELTTVIQS